MLRWSVEAFLVAGAVEELVVVARAEELELVEGSLSGVNFPWRTVAGGARRQDSSLSGIKAARGEFVLIHDAARPLVTPELIRAVAHAAWEHGAAVPAIPVRDTLRYVEGGLLSAKIVDRTDLHAIQTPQGFRRDLILRALEETNRKGLQLTDDATAVILSGRRVVAVPGDLRNFKVTYPEDLKLAAALLSPRG